MMKYKQVAHRQRYQITAMLAVGTKQKVIAEVIGLHPSTVSREIRRNSFDGNKYIPQLADRAAAARKRSKGVARIPGRTLKFVQGRLKRQHSPDQISGELREAGHVTMSHQSIYTYVERDRLMGGKLFENLRHATKKRKKYGKEAKSKSIPGRRPLAERPEIANERGRYGDLEIDLIIGKQHNKAILTIVDRKTRYLWMTLLQTKSADEVADACCRRLRKAKSQIRTITSDNGREFANHARIAKTLDLDYFFADPYSPWQRGTSENTNGLIRQYFPKGSSFEGISERRLRTVENLLNQRPRKGLGYKTPKQQLLKEQKIALAC
jgi:transposase, IS30 family